MPTPMTRRELDTLEDEALIGACLAPVIARIRGRDFDVKSTVYRELTPAQRALLSFHVLHGHAADVGGFWHHVRLFATEWNIWPQLEGAAHYFADEELLNVYRKVSAAVHASAHRDPDVATALHRAYLAAAGNTVRVAAEHIRAHPERFAHPS